MFAGMEMGVFFTVDGGSRWIKLTGGVPSIPFRDLVIQRRENDLVGATFGRGFYVFDDYTALRTVSEDLLDREFEMFPVRDAWWYIPRRPLGGGDKAAQGASFFIAPNPPFGATFTYYLQDEILTRKKTRRESEKSVEEQGGDTPYPGWDALREESLEEDPAIVLTGRDANGEVMRRLTGSVEAGFHRVAWDLRYPSVAPWKPGAEPASGDATESGYLVAPGTFTVSAAKRVGGDLVEFGRTESFEVVPLREGTLPGATPERMAAFKRELADLQRAIQGAAAAIDETAVQLDGIREALTRSTAGDAGLDDEVRRLDRQLDTLRETLSGNSVRRRAGDPGPIPITRRIEVAERGNGYSTYGPTPTHLASVEIARGRFTGLRRELARLIDVELPELKKKLDAAGVPWTPGREVPRPN